jgi:prepilin peptidase CpaA
MAWQLETVLVLLAVLAGLYDLRFRRIPNWLNVTGAVAGVVLQVLLGGRAGAASALLGLACAFAVYIPLYLVRGMGAGDVKLMMAIGLIVGPRQWIRIFLITALLGGVVALAVAFARKRLRQTCGNTGTILFAVSHGSLPFEFDPELDIHSRKAMRIPHGTVIAGGVLAALLMPLFVPLG